MRTQRKAFGGEDCLLSPQVSCHDVFFSCEPPWIYAHSLIARRTWSAKSPHWLRFLPTLPIPSPLDLSPDSYIMFKLFRRKKEGDEASEGGDDLASHIATHTTGIPAKGDIAIRSYRKVFKNPRYKKERDAFEARLKLLQMGYKSPHVRRILSHARLIVCGLRVTDVNHCRECQAPSD